MLLIAKVCIFAIEIVIFGDGQCSFVLKLHLELMPYQSYLDQRNFLIASALIKIEPVHEISNNVVCATSKASDQPAHTLSLIRAFLSFSGLSSL